MYNAAMRSEETTSALNLRNFPPELRRRLHAFALLRGEEMQDFIPRWLRERLESEEGRKPQKLRQRPRKF
jgi:hypothetical protein